MTTQKIETKRPRLQFSGIDLLRFFAAFLVLLRHLAFDISYHRDDILNPFTGNASLAHFTALSCIGWVGVEIFFVISGFVIAFTANGTTAFQFFKSRFLRLVPTVWICATITALIFLTVTTTPVSDVILLYIKTLIFVPKGPWIDIPYWTLTVEIAFYSYIFLILCWNQFQRISFYVGALGLMSSLTWLSLLALSFFNIPLTEVLVNKIIKHTPYHISLMGSGTNFAFGVFMWLIFLNRCTPSRLFLFFVFFAGSMCEIFLHRRYYGHSSFWDALVPVTVWYAAMVFMIASVYYNDKFQGFFPGTIRTIGLMTFPLYLIHMTAGMWIINTLSNNGMAPYPALILTSIGIFGFSWLMVMYIEPAARALFRLPLEALENHLKKKPRFSYLFEKSIPLR